MLSDQEKLDWVNKTLKWIDDCGGIAACIEHGNNSHDMPYDVFFDVMNLKKRDEE